MKARTAPAEAPENRRQSQLDRDRRCEQRYAYDRSFTAPRGGSEVGDLSTLAVVTAWRVELVAEFFEWKAVQCPDDRAHDVAAGWLAWRLKTTEQALEPVVLALFRAELIRQMEAWAAKAMCYPNPLSLVEQRRVVAEVKSNVIQPGEGPATYIRRIARLAKLLPDDAPPPAKDMPAPAGVVVKDGADWREENVEAIFGPRAQPAKEDVAW